MKLYTFLRYSTWKYPFRTLFTILGFGVFLVLAAGSDENRNSTYIPPPAPPPPEVVGKENALSWAKSNSADLASKIQDLETEKRHAREEVYRLEALKDQFPEQVSKISGTISEWKKVEIALDAALADVNSSISDAYVANQVDGESQELVLSQVFTTWKPEADVALNIAKSQRDKTAP